MEPVEARSVNSATNVGEMRTVRVIVLLSPPVQVKL